MLSKKKNIVIALVFTLILAAACYYYFAIYNSVHDGYVIADYKGYSSAESLFSGADLVVIGSPLKKFEDREVLLKERSRGVIEYIVTSTEMNVEKVLKGPEEETVHLNVIEPIGVRQTLRGKIRIALDGYTAMKKDSRYLVFLSKNTFGQYSVINMQAGKFNLDGTDPDDFSGENPYKQKIFTELTTNYAEEVEGFN
ncbi:hypothetical protein [Paenibacillus aceti]|uniref:Uncharacterized protein n=1 Tax=Paenibacillus aceti TaxID=1820010 RepID=A0ABQ1W4R7_9BACL|nr:hypothetical protein [Paenibacillus aceti]GGG14183.1 hypothetical protein GCM10010913_39970 [Paenibacillus aceti]